MPKLTVSAKISLSDYYTADTNMIFAKKTPDEVFTPRAAEVNRDMYIQRRQHEDALVSALRGKLHIVIHGESGTGKSWLYKKVLADQGACFVIANLANASRLGSITAELKNVVDREGAAVKTEYEEEKSASLNAAVAAGEISHAGKFQIGQKEPFEQALENLRSIARKRPAVLILDNLETIFGGPLLKELADLLILCDDARYAAYNVHIIIVGVPSGIRDYYYQTPHHATVANRLYEIPEVARLSRDQARDLAKKGFVDQLQYKVDDVDGMSEHVAWITDGVPQMVHEYCLELANIPGNNRHISPASMKLADAAWLSKSMYHVYSVIESHMNERDTKAGRRNQTLLALSRCATEHFKAPEVERILREEFPGSTTDTVLNLPQMLGLLAGGDRPILRKTPKGDAYQFADPKYRMVLRTMLSKTPDERVVKCPLSRA